MSWCRNRAFSARSSAFPLVMSASVQSTREVVDGLSQREQHAWSVRQLEQIRCLIKVNTQPTKLNLSFVKIGTWPESTSSMDVVDCTRVSRASARRRVLLRAICQFPEQMSQVASTGRWRRAFVRRATAFPGYLLRPQSSYPAHQYNPPG